MPQRNTNKFQRVIYSIPFLLFLSVMVVIVMLAAWNMYQTNYGTKQRIERLRTEHQELQQREKIISSAAMNVSTERGLEAEIREKFSVAKEGERVIVLIDDDEVPVSVEEKERKWWRNVLSYIWPF
jgi:ABC-type lipoprotein release transport system permease subunit